MVVIVVRMRVKKEPNPYPVHNSTRWPGCQAKINTATEATPSSAISDIVKISMPPRRCWPSYVIMRQRACPPAGVSAWMSACCLLALLPVLCCLLVLAPVCCLPVCCLPVCCLPALAKVLCCLLTLVPVLCCLLALVPALCCLPELAPALCCLLALAPVLCCFLVWVRVSDWGYIPGEPMRHPQQCTKQ